MKMKKIIAGILMFAMLAALTVVGASAAFTPSVENKEAEIDSATINGEAVAEGEIAVTPLKDKETANLPEETKKQLDDAVKELEEKIPENVIPDVNTEDYKVGAVVDITYSGTASLENAEIKVKVNVDFGDAENVQAIYQNTETGVWEDAKCVYENGVATLTMKHFCPVAFLVENKSVIVSDGSGAPQTGDSMTPAVIALGALLVSGAVAAAVVSRKRENA